MTSWSGQNSPIAAARRRFISSLPRKSQELRQSIAKLGSQSASHDELEQFKRRLHALHASAQVFQHDTLVDALKVGMDRVEGVLRSERTVNGDDLEVLKTLAIALPTLGSQSQAPDSVSVSQPQEQAPATVVGFANDSGSREEPTHKKNTERSRGLLTTSPPKRASGSFTAVPVPKSSPRAAQKSSHPRLSLGVLSVLLVDNHNSADQLQDNLPAESFELLHAQDNEEALRLARSTAPDIVVVGAQMLEGYDKSLISRLRSDPLTDFVPVLVFVEQLNSEVQEYFTRMGADLVLAKSVPAKDLISALRKLTDTDEGHASTDVLGTVTTDEIAERMIREIRKGLLDSQQDGKHGAVDLGDGSEVLAATWSAISRVREAVVKASEGKIRFRDAPERGGPAMVAVMEDQHPSDEQAASHVALANRRILIVDDDPSVRWFFAGLLREENAKVVEASDGFDALRLAREQRPDVVISDILMPVMDGFALCRELKRDPGLADVPVILLSWKDDFLQRMRELNSGASAYLRKEAKTSQILAKVREVLKPRARLEERLNAGGEVRGRLEGIGIVPVLRTIAAVRPNARLILRDAWNLFEVDIRQGSFASLTRTATDGSFSRGEAALPQLLGATSGRFTITEADDPVRHVFDEALEDSLRRGTRFLGALIDAVSGTGLMHVASLGFNEEVVSAFIRTSPERVRWVVNELYAGRGPRELILNGAVAPQTLEAVLVDMARRGALRGAYGTEGEDRVAMALKQRESLPEAIGGSLSGIISDSLSGASYMEASSQSYSRSPSEQNWLIEQGVPAQQLPDQGTKDDLQSLVEETQRSISSYPPAHSSSVPGHVVFEDERSRRDVLPAKTVNEKPRVAAPVNEFHPQPTTEEGDLPQLPDGFASSYDSSLHIDFDAALRPDSPSRATAPVVSPHAPRSHAQDDAIDITKLSDDDTKENRSNHWLWGMSLVFLVSLGFIGFRVWQMVQHDETVLAATAARQNTSLQGSNAKKTPETSALPENQGVEDQSATEKFYGRVQEGIVNALGTVVKEGQGLLVLEDLGSDENSAIWINGRRVSLRPKDSRAELPLPAGQHELAFRKDHETSYRFVAIQPGYTQFIRVPLMGD
ncbi:MAG: response regulator [Myxococcales bacterium]|nr:MAG: response regulator [Myxococcales bacterium]